jgi:dipeptide/tripeptide permease
VCTALFIASLVVSTALAGGTHFPSPFQAEALSQAYFEHHADAVRWGAFFQFGSAIPLGIFAATAVSRLQFLGVRVAGTFIALLGGFGASFMLATSALVQWVLAQGGTLEPRVVRVLHLLAFATGGVGYVVFVGLLVAGISVTGGLSTLLPKWLMWLGLVVAGIAELAASGLVLETATYLLPLARFPAFVWMILVGLKLPLSRRDAPVAEAGELLVGAS